MSKTKKILVYRLGSLGDTVMALPCFNKIKEIYYFHELLLLTNKSINSKAPAIISIIGDDYFSKVFDYPIGTRNIFLLLKLIVQLRKERIDVIINITAARTKKSALRDELFFKLAGIKKQIGFPKQKEDLSASISTTPHIYKWEALRLAERMSTLGFINLENNKCWDLHFTKAEIKKIESLLDKYSASRFIALSPGTKMQSKDWGVQNWVNLVQKLKIKFPDHVLLIAGAKDEQQIGKLCLDEWGRGLNTCGLLSPRESAIMFSRASIFIGHDSGPMHLAAAVSTPCVAVFSARNIPIQWFSQGYQ